MKGSALHRLKRQHSGFSLMELAIVLMIIGTLMSGVLVAVSQTAESARVTNARAQLREIEEALYGFAVAYGRLPCPATNASSPANYEDTACPEHGFVPSGTLGLYGSANDDGLLVDPWKNPIRYSLITTATADNPDFSDAADIKTFFNNDFIASGGMFSICETSACVAADKLADTVPAVILSLGANWSTYSSADEVLNAGDQAMSGYPIKDDFDFVSRTYSEDNFDDQIVWLSPYVVFGRLVEAGQLP
jgi:prepilin-type N-terminal cleavage/methylation domain-containing protein